MASPMVHVEYQPSYSGSDGDSEQSDETAEAVEDFKDEAAVETAADGKEEPQERQGLADVMAKILHKNVPAHKQVILAKGQTDKEIRKRKKAKEDEDGEKKQKTDTVDTSAEFASQEKKKLWEDMCRVKPNPLERTKERQLQRIATRGVVQLFNAVRKQQKTVEDEVQMAGSERKKEKVMEKVTKHQFLSMLKGSSVSNVTVEKNTDNLEKQSEQKQVEKEKKWSILRDDYMMGAKMKDWNKESSGDDDDDDPGDPEMSDSD